MRRARGGRGGASGGSGASRREKHVSSSKKEESEARTLATRIAEMAPARGSIYSHPGGLTPLFTDLPLSKYTQSGLNDAKYFQPTAIQLAAIPHALAGLVRSLCVVIIGLCDNTLPLAVLQS